MVDARTVVRASICLAFVVVGASCNRSVEMRPADVAGAWSRPGDAFPPVNLILSDSASVLRARLRLSGTDSRGTFTLEGNRIRLTLEGRPMEIRGDFVSPTELRLQFGGERTYTLYRSGH